MRLTVYTDYALRVLMYLAVHPEPKPTIGEISSSYSVSRNHLMKVVYDLGVAGYIGTVRGKNGGLRLARRPEDIGLGELIRQTEPDMALVPCFDPVNSPCAITPACRLRGALHQARAAFFGVLDGYTLADLVGNRPALEHLLVRGDSRSASDRPQVESPPSTGHRAPVARRSARGRAPT
ncbi:MAG: Rrf2 family transcriptional regulator [Caulobacterales bacterium]|jgi:Rrf2 family nitric oxide-sensitive transcriptional repressor